jgi:predicted O-methyltransferase YrrM
LILLKAIHSSFHFFKHWLLEMDEHSLHSPYLFDLYSTVFRKAGKMPDDPEIENLRHRYKQDHRIISGKSFGAGSRFRTGNRFSLNRIARSGITRPKYSRLLLALIDHFGFSRILELGTSIGLNTLYLSKGRKVEDLVTFEGNEELAGIARRNFDLFYRGKIRVITGDINHTLPEYLRQADPVDFVFLDANHTAGATLHYLDMLEWHLNRLSVVVIDDIYWSSGMTQAWKQICSSAKNKLCLDIFQMGIVIRDPDGPAGHHVLAF